MDLGDDTNIYEDISVVVGTDLFWGFEVEPLDATGATAVFNMNGTPFSMTVVVSSDGENKISDFTLYIAASSLPAAGLYQYNVVVTFAGGQMLQYGNGKVLLYVPA